MSKEASRTTFIKKTSQGEIAYYDTKPKAPASTPTLLFLHGHLANKEFFEKQLSSPLLTPYRLIAIDFPGYGKSAKAHEPKKVYSFPGFADVVTEFVNMIDPKKLIVIGWSAGGHVAMELTSRLLQLEGILITGAPPIEVSFEGLSAGFQHFDEKIMDCYGKGNLTREEAAALATISGYDFTPEKEFIIEAVLKTDEAAKTLFPQSIGEGIGRDQKDIVRTWPHPIAVVAGGSDFAINTDYIVNNVEFKNLWQKKVHVIPGSGHSCFLENAEQFNKILSQFCEDTFTSAYTAC